MKTSLKTSVKTNLGKSSKQPAPPKLNESNAEADSKNSSVRQSNSSLKKKNPGDSFDAGKRPVLPKFSKGRADPKAKKGDSKNTDQLSNIIPAQIQNTTATENINAGQANATITNQLNSSVTPILTTEGDEKSTEIVNVKRQPPLQPKKLAKEEPPSEKLNESAQVDQFLERYAQDSKQPKLDETNFIGEEDAAQLSVQNPVDNTAHNISTEPDIQRLRIFKGTKDEVDASQLTNLEEQKSFGKGKRAPQALETSSLLNISRISGLSPKLIQSYAHIRSLVPDSITVSQERRDSKLITPIRSPQTTSALKSGNITLDKIRERVSSPTRDKEDAFTRRQHYLDVLRDIDGMKFNENIDEAEELILKAEKLDQEAHRIVENKLGKKYANGLFYLLNQYSEDNGTSSNRMSGITLTKMLKEFKIIGKNISKEQVEIIYSKRCRKSLVDFGAFVDILYKIGAYFNKQIQDKTARFREFLDSFVLNQISDVLSKKPQKPSFSKIGVFENGFSINSEALQLFESNDSLLKHIFIIYSTYDFKYSDRTFLSLKAYRKFIQDFSVVPLLLRVKEAIELFRRMQMAEHSIIDFKGFVKIIGVIAHLGFNKPIYKGKYDTYRKKLMKLFGFLQQANSQLADELVLNKIMQFRDDKHALA